VQATDRIGADLGRSDQNAEQGAAGPPPVADGAFRAR
jgi:hypothetical protein